MFGICLDISGTTEPAYRLSGLSRGRGGGDAIPGLIIGLGFAEYAGRYSDGPGDTSPGDVVDERGSSVEGETTVKELDSVDCVFGVGWGIVRPVCNGEPDCERIGGGLGFKVEIGGEGLERFEVEPELGIVHTGGSLSLFTSTPEFISNT